MPTFMFRRERAAKADFRLPSEEAEGVPRRAFPSTYSLSPEYEEDGGEVWPFAGVLPARVCDKDVSDDKLWSSDVIASSTCTHKAYG
jgi:hypothetical protein